MSKRPTTAYPPFDRSPSPNPGEEGPASPTSAAQPAALPEPLARALHGNLIAEVAKELGPAGVLAEVDRLFCWTPPPGLVEESVALPKSDAEGADADTARWTALGVASLCGAPEVTMLLLQCGASATIAAGPEGWTALHCAAVSAAPRAAACWDHLCAHGGANRSAQDARGHSADALRAAAAGGRGDDAVTVLARPGSGSGRPSDDANYADDGNGADAESGANNGGRDAENVADNRGRDSDANEAFRRSMATHRPTSVSEVASIRGDAPPWQPPPPPAPDAVVYGVGDARARLGAGGGGGGYGRPMWRGESPGAGGAGGGLGHHNGGGSTGHNGGGVDDGHGVDGGGGHGHHHDGPGVNLGGPAAPGGVGYHLGASAVGGHGHIVTGGAQVQGAHAPPHDAALEAALNDFNSVEFRMYRFKVQLCPSAAAHDWTRCPFTHPGEKARRRDPRVHRYSGVTCPDFRKGLCKRGDACPYAHGVFECWLHPTRYRVQMCNDGIACQRSVCFFAHTVDELRDGEGGVAAPGAVRGGGGMWGGRAVSGDAARRLAAAAAAGAVPARGERGGGGGGTDWGSGWSGPAGQVALPYGSGRSSGGRGDGGWGADDAGWGGGVHAQPEAKDRWLRQFGAAHGEDLTTSGGGGHHHHGGHGDDPGGGPAAGGRPIYQGPRADPGGGNDSPLRWVDHHAGGHDGSHGHSLSHSHGGHDDVAVWSGADSHGGGAVPSAADWGAGGVDDGRLQDVVRGLETLPL